MENSSFKNLNDLEGMEDFIFFQQSPVDSIEELSSVSMAFGEPVLDFKRPPDWCGVEEKRPLKQLKTTSSCKPEKIITHSTPTTFHFVNNTTTSTAPSPPIVSQLSFGHENDDHVVIKKSSSSYDHGSTTRHPSFAQERMLAERRRREHLTQRFIALSALLPGLKKMDKASVLGDAIKYMKQLQQKVELLEEQASKLNQASVLVRKHEPPRARNENPSSSDDESNYSIGSMISSDDYSSVPAVPEIEARMCNNDVLIKIQCEKKKGLLEKTVGEIEKLNLSVVNSSVMSFGDSSLSISLVAQKDEGFSSDMKQLVNNLRAAITKYSSAK